jgi:fatty acid desaturase
MEDEFIVIPILILGISFFIAYIFFVKWILRKTDSANDKTARKRWLTIISIHVAVFAFLFIPLIGNLLLNFSYLAINLVSCLLILSIPLLIALALLEFSRTAPWFWKNKQIFPNKNKKAE